MILSQRDVDALRLLCWCQFISPKDLSGVVTEAERKNLIGAAFLMDTDQTRTNQVLPLGLRDHAAQIFRADDLAPAQ